MHQSVHPFVMVIFGATGELTARKLMPALYSLLKEGILSDRFYVVGVARRNFTNDQFRNLMKEAVSRHSRRTIDTFLWEKLAKNLFYEQGFFEDINPYKRLVKLLSSFDKELGACITRFFYLATPPQNYSEILKHLSSSRLSEGCGQGSSKWTRVLIEKPFGKDLDTARKLEEQLSKTFEERQIYRIDHYLAKETIQNILVFRFANQTLEQLWSKDHIDNVQITLAESAGVGMRGKFYEGVGALRDVAQNHLMAMLAYITMEEPKSFSADDTRNERIKVLRAIRCIEEQEVKHLVVRGQYGEGESEGRKILAYRQEKNVDPTSFTETFVALKLFIDNPRWQGVPFYLRTGKRLEKSEVRIDIQFKNPRSELFKKFILSPGSPANVLTIRVQPREGIALRFFAKSPGLTFALSPVDMDFSYFHSFNKEMIDSYEKLLVDSMLGDQTLFATSSGYFATWELITKIIKGWESLPPPKFPNYSPASWGPKEAEELITRDGRRWLS